MPVSKHAMLKVIFVSQCHSNEVYQVNYLKLLTFVRIEYMLKIGDIASVRMILLTKSTNVLVSSRILYHAVRVYHIFSATTCLVLHYVLHSSLSI